MSNPKPLYLMATIVPKAEHYEDCRNAIQEILPQTRAEVGCQLFMPMENMADRTLHLFEIWDDEAALIHHHEQAYTLQVFKKYQRWLAEPVKIIKASPFNASVH